MNGTEAFGNTAAILAGGGIDSTVCMHLMKAEGISFRALHIDFGQEAGGLEWRAVQTLAAHFDSPSSQIKVTGDLPVSSGEIRGRNGGLIHLALMHLRPQENLICIGIHAGTPFYDCSMKFLDRMSTLVAECTDSRVRLTAPLHKFNKPDVVSLAKSFDLPLHLTHSCQRAVHGGCGSCHSCLDRKALAC